jgi:hypothetical protein
MYKFFLMEINLAEEVRQSQNRAAAMSLSSRQQRPTNPSKPLPPSFCYDANKVAGFDCPSCECKGSVMFLINVNLSNSVKSGIKSLQSTNSLVNKTNVLSAAAGHLSRMQMPSEEELHTIQQNVMLTTKLRASGSDIRQTLNQDPRKKGKRHSQNGLG